MPTKNGFDPDHSPLFLADEPEQEGIGKAWDRAVILSRVLKASILVATATAIGIAILSVGNPVTLFADVTASLVDKSALQPGTDQSTPTIQSTADAPALPLTAKDAPPATKLLPPLNRPVRVRRKIVSHRLKPCLGNSKLGRPRKRRRHGSGPYSPFKMPRHRLRKMPRHRLQKMPEQLFGPCKSTDTSGASKVRELSYGPCKILEKGSGGSKMHGYRSRPHKTPEHRTSLCKMPSHRHSCKPSVGAIRPGRK